MMLLVLTALAVNLADLIPWALGAIVAALVVGFVVQCFVGWELKEP